MNDEMLKQACRRYLHAIETDDEVDMKKEQDEVLGIVVLWAQTEAIEQVEKKNNQKPRRRTGHIRRKRRGEPDRRKGG